MRSKSAKIAFKKGYRVKWNSVYSPRGNKLKLKLQDTYPKFNISHKGKIITVKAHQLAAYQKFGDTVINNDYVIRHIDDDNSNIRLANMDYGTMADNYEDMKRNREANEYYAQLQKEEEKALCALL